ncbi:hypothetical protein [Pseudomonas sp. MWU12-2323]|uniref:hypothetical protein n=1 Tax=Pseudomonas sp. MWU12-2323 TaxID=2651296 RepID=UPI00128CA82E|nr:hypothetical protein [Pseudomonas sp. MWU12-2323]MPQ69506.1 hypothetical protein [Pseudomonas sp. MWU12-2323]
MLAGIFTLLLLYFGSPVLLLLMIGVLFRELTFYYGGWMIPAVFGLTMGIMLKITGHGDPNADFASLAEVIAGSHIVGIETPLVLITIGILSLMAKPVCRMFKPSE